METFQKKALTSDRENKKLKQRIANFEQLESEQMGGSQELVDKLNADLLLAAEEKAALEARIKELEDEVNTG